MTPARGEHGRAFEEAAHARSEAEQDSYVKCERYAGRDAPLKLGGGILFSRLLGFFRDMLVAFVLGPGADAFLVAFRLPNALRRLLAEGTLSLAPAADFARIEQEQGPRAAMAFIRRLALACLLLALPIAALLALAAPALAFCLAPGLSPEFLEAASFYLRLCLPYLPLAALTAVLCAATSALGRFGPQAYASALFNCALLFAGALAFLLPSGPGRAERLLCLGVLAGGVLQLMAAGKALGGFASAVSGHVRTASEHTNQTPPTRAKAPLSDPLVRGALRRMPALIAGGSGHHLHALAGTIMASFLAPGSISALYFAERLFELPLGLAGVAVGLVAMPRLAALAVQNNSGEFARTLEKSLRFSFFISLPAAAGLAALARPLTLLLFGHGAFGEEGAATSAEALAVYALALPAMCAARPLLAAAAALSGTRAVALAAFGGLAAMVLTGAGGAFFWGVSGIGAGIAVGAWTQTLLLAVLVRKETQWSFRTGCAFSLLRMAAAAAAMAGALSLVPFPEGAAALAAAVAALVAVSMAAWFGLALALDNEEAKSIARVLRPGG